MPSQPRTDDRDLRFEPDPHTSLDGFACVANTATMVGIIARNPSPRPMRVSRETCVGHLMSIEPGGCGMYHITGIKTDWGSEDAPDLLGPTMRRSARHFEDVFRDTGFVNLPKTSGC